MLAQLRPGENARQFTPVGYGTGISRAPCIAEDRRMVAHADAAHSPIFQIVPTNKCLMNPGSATANGRKSGAKVGLRREGLLDLPAPAFQGRPRDAKGERGFVDR